VSANPGNSGDVVQRRGALSTVCSIVPQGELASAGITLGGFGAVGGSANLVTKFMLRDDEGFQFSGIQIFEVGKTPAALFIAGKYTAVVLRRD
jgi:hypothetical protein